jgi:hypothetical protein
MDTSKTESTRTCEQKNCEASGPQPITEFYWKPDRNDWDKTCKSCRRRDRRADYRAKRAARPEPEEPVPPTPIVPDEILTPEEPVEPEGEQAVAGNEQIDEEDIARAVSVFSMLRAWRDRARKNGQINW